MRSISAALSRRLIACLRVIERIGNRLPDPVTMFVILCGIVVLVSWLLAGSEVGVAQRDGQTAQVVVKSLLSIEGLRWMLTSAVDNFLNFAPLGPVLTMMLGLGVAERTGWISTGLSALVKAVPSRMLTAAVVFAGVMSSMAADAGYVVLTPLGAVLFATAGKHPLAGLAAAFAGVSGGYSANLFITGLDPLLARLTSQAANMIDPTYHVDPTANYYFMVASTFLITAVGAWVTERIVIPTLGPWKPEEDVVVHTEAHNADQWSQFKSSLWVLFAFLGLVVCLFVGDPAVLRLPAQADLPEVERLKPLFDSVEIVVAILFLVPAVWFGWKNGVLKSDKDVAKMASETMASMGPYVVLAFVAGQFVAYFNWTGVGVVTAVKGASLLQHVGLSGIGLLALFVMGSGTVNLLIGSASAKWAFMAPIFVPMLMLMGFSPELVQVAYRVGDSVTNVISPLLPYFPILIVFAQRYDKKAGLGTLMATMFPYSIAFGIVWLAFLFLWVALGIPLGPGGSLTYPS